MNWINTAKRLPPNKKTRPVICDEGYQIASYNRKDHNGNYNPKWISIAGYNVKNVEMWQPLPGEEI
jgi:hypothetical protein